MIKTKVITTCRISSCGDDGLLLTARRARLIGDKNASATSRALGEVSKVKRTSLLFVQHS